MPQISVDTDSLAANGAALMDWLAGGPAPGAEPASAHSTSLDVANNLTAQSQALGMLVNHGYQVRSEGGVAHAVTAASFRATDDNNAAIIAGQGSTSGAVSAAMPVGPVGSVSDPVLPGIPTISPLTPMTGEAHSTALHSGPGSGSLRVLADYWQSQATTLDNVAAETSQTGASVNANWSDGIQTAGANTVANGNWWSEMAGRARALSSAANDAADQHDLAVAAMPHPTADFVPAHAQLTAAIQANQASGGLLTGQVHAAATHLALLQSTATETATTHHAASTAAVNSTGGPGTAAPKIAGGTGGTGSPGGTGPGAPANQGNTVTANNTGGTGLTQLLSNSGLTSAGTNTGNNSAAQMAQTAAMLAPLSTMGMMGPMSAMSGLGNQARPDALTGVGSGQGGVPAPAAATDGGLGSDFDSTFSAGAGGVGGGVEAVGREGAALPMASVSHASPNPVSGPPASVSLPAEEAAVSPASAGGGMSTYPPMMGGQGAGDGGPQRNVRLFPDRRAVWRPMPNTEAVFGELERERRPRGKRAAQDAAKEEGANEG